MSTESLFRIAFWSLFGGMIAMQAYSAARSRRTGEHRAVVRTATEREGWRHTVIRAVRSICLCAFLVLYAINPPWLKVLSVPFPDWLRWTGAALGVLSLAVYAWARVTLGREWSSRLQTREAHHLVTTGPYARVRHPIYLAILSFLTSITLVAANWFLVAFLAVSIADLALRIPEEEQMMIEAFGDEYVAYMQRTGRLLPRK